jgi:hypothetical protein
MNASNQLCKELIPTYKDFSNFNKDTFVGYKLVEKKNLNYYSVVTGMFRYKAGRINHSSYSGLYKKNPEFYNEKLFNRLAICKTPEEAFNFLIKYKELANKNADLVVLEIQISGNLEKATCCNAYCENCEVIIGDCIDRVKEISYPNPN